MNSKRKVFCKDLVKQKKKSSLNKSVLLFLKYDVEKGADPAKIHQKFIELCNLISKDTSDDKDVNDHKEHMFPTNAQYLFNNLSFVQYELPKPPREEPQQVVDLSNMMPSSDLQW
ncbi:hypothetical protein [Legionella longbeachae]|uniref:hypothetical protein n=1 Tax=Legionella longbeachae TaxID=450 RepID=UPI00139075DC|nr:hypothetical protein [Legionella longbeachae]UAK47409.1 hypothetical protein K8O86_04260 [Legionella longbeachae]